jgi:hypothetical protein
MTMRTRYNLICSCGHRGTIVRKENDQPYSKDWDSFSLENLNGNSFYSEQLIDWDVVFKNMKPVCPQCKKRLTRDNFSS